MRKGWPAIICLVIVATAVSSAGSAAPAATTTGTRLPRGVTASIKLGVGVAPLAVVSAYGSIWVSSHRSTDLYRINPRTNRIVATIDVGQVSCGLIGAGLGQIWVTPCQDTWTLVRVDARRNRVVGKIHPTSLAVAIGARSAWVGTKTFGPGAIERINASGRIGARIRVGSGPGAVAFGGGRVWNVNGDDGTLDEIDPTTNRVLATVPFVPPQSYGYLTYFAHRVWFSGGIAGAAGTWIAKYNPKTGKTSILRIRGEALSQFGDHAAVTGAGSLWLRTSDGRVTRIDPHTGHKVATYPADPDGGGGFLAVAYGSLWIANFGSDTVWRVRIHGS